MKYIVFDISNLLYRSFYAQTNESDDVLAGLATHSALVMLNKYFKIYKPDRVIMAFDRSSWRKEYTASKECISKKPYKGNRRQDMTPAQQAKFLRFVGHLREFETLIREHTTIRTLARDRCEADDLIAGFVQQEASDDNEIIVVTSDSDMFQLMKHKNVSIISPIDGKPATLPEFDNDPNLYLFAKCIRGDSTDNIQSAYPRVRMSRIKKAYEDEFEKVTLMKETWVNEKKETFVVEQLFKENQLLIDLEKQPADIRQLIEETVREELAKEKQFSMFFIMKFIGKYKLNRIKEGIEQYLPLLSR